jgi:hypothetical protein
MKINHTTKKAFGILCTVSISILFAWVAIWNGCEYDNYKWIWSQSHLLRSGQYLLRALWAISILASPFLWLFVTAIISMNLIPKE